MTQTEKEAATLARIASDNLFLERALILMWQRQTATEQISKNTHHTNSRGFNKPDGGKRGLGGIAAWVTNGKAPLGKRMNDQMREKARKRLTKYVGQLVEIVEEVKAGTTKLPK
jgi:hypothetical protein